ISGVPYLHIEGSPMPMFFNEIIHQMVLEKKIKVTPRIETESSEHGTLLVLKGLAYEALEKANMNFPKSAKHVLSSVASLLGSDISLETRYFPNLYQKYAQTNLYEIIPFERLPGGKRPHLSWKSWGKRIFRLKWE
ncbi:MAG: hypothetical protein D6767_01245, partial [Candidatus Hydrogenedentota bacterium]